jgi:xeroderma pigmentosum group C-complementing protein
MTGGARLLSLSFRKSSSSTVSSDEPPFGVWGCVACFCVVLLTLSPLLLSWLVGWLVGWLVVRLLFIHLYVQDRGEMDGGDSGSDGWEDGEEGGWGISSLEGQEEEKGKEDDATIDWEDGDAEDDDNQRGEDMEIPLVDASGEIVIELPVEGGHMLENGRVLTPAEAKRNAQKRRRDQQKARVRALITHQAHLVSLIARAVLLNKWCNDAQLNEAAIALLPEEISQNPHSRHWNTKDGIQALVGWCRVNFTQVDPDESAAGDEGGCGSAPARLIRVLRERKGTAHELVQIFVALCRAMGLKSRYVTCLDPLPSRPPPARRRSATPGSDKGKGKLRVVKLEPQVQTLRSPAWAEVLLAMSPSSSAVKSHTMSEMEVVKGGRAKRRIGTATTDHKKLKPEVDTHSFDEDESILAGCKNESGNAEDPEVQVISREQALALKIPRKKGWVHVDPFLNKVDQPDSIVQFRRFRKRDMPYVLAVNEEGRIQDVTERYCVMGRYKQVLHLRGNAESWWEDVQKMWNFGRGGGGPAQRREESELHLKVKSEPVPKSLSGLRGHPFYAVCGNRKGIKPGAKIVGLCEGKKVYWKDDLADLRGVTKWRELGRQVTEEARKAPLQEVKVAKRKGIEGEKMGLYGEWQTEPIKRPALKNGQIPVNGHGNIEVWGGNEYFLPEGTALLRLHKLDIVARKLGIQCVPALADFQSVGERKVPVTDGFVVLRDNADTLSSAWQEWNEMKEYDLARAKEKALLSRWKSLVNLAMTRVKLEQEYNP